jgi:hypothetical protein
MYSVEPIQENVTEENYELLSFIPTVLGPILPL